MTNYALLSKAIFSPFLFYNGLGLLFLGSCMEYHIRPKYKIEKEIDPESKKYEVSIVNPPARLNYHYMRIVGMGLTAAPLL